MSTERQKKFCQEKEKIFMLEKERKQLLHLFCSKHDLIEGSFREVLIQCGRKECRCKIKPFHLTTRLSRWENGKLKNQVVRVADREHVTQLSNNYKAHKQALRDLERINKIEREIVKTLLNLKTKQYV